MSQFYMVEHCNHFFFFGKLSLLTGLLKNFCKCSQVLLEGLTSGLSFVEESLTSPQSHVCGFLALVAMAFQFKEKFGKKIERYTTQTVLDNIVVLSLLFNHVFVLLFLLFFPLQLYRYHICFMVHLL